MGETKEFILNDITRCSNKECKRKDCLRHFDNIQGEGIYSFCEFKEEGCKDYLGGDEEDERWN